MKKPYYDLPGIPVPITFGQVCVYYAERGFPARAIEVLLGRSVSVGAIRQALSRARIAGRPVPMFSGRVPKGEASVQPSTGRISMGVPPPICGA